MDFAFCHCKRLYEGKIKKKKTKNRQKTGKGIMVKSTKERHPIRISQKERYRGVARSGLDGRRSSRTRTSKISRETPQSNGVRT